jgi:phosphatidylserine/phosphatidylglycerophosphate/cardiolipin synthase-like enzyme
VLISEVLPWPAGNASEEFVELHVPADAGGVADLRGWTLTDNDGARELVMGRVTMEPGAFLVIWNSKRPAGAGGLSCNRGSSTWNNYGDDVVLLDAGGRARARLAYGDGPAVDPPPPGWPNGTEPAPGKGMSLSLDPSTGDYVIAQPSPGRAGPSTGGTAGTLAATAATKPAAQAQSPPVPAGNESRCSGPAEPGPPTAVLIAAVHPGGGPGWETVVLENRGDAMADLSGLTLSDSEGTWRLPKGCQAPARARVSISTNSTAHEVLWGAPPDALAVQEGPFALADAGDGLVLLDPGGRALDSVWYGTASRDPPEGWAGDPVPCGSKMSWGRLILRGPGIDTGTAADWAWPEEPVCGWLEPWEPQTLEGASVSCFVTPDEGLRAVCSAISGARECVSGAVYRLTSDDLVSALAERARAGVEVRLLIEGGPAGASASELGHRDGLLAALVEAGAHVHMTFPTAQGERVQPYAFHHAKYLVVDSRTAVVTTENWVASAFPLPGEAGEYASRGWGAVVECDGLARALETVFDHDVRTCADPWDPAGTTPLRLPAPPVTEGLVGAPATATLLVGPEGWGSGYSGVLDLVSGADTSLDVELADLEVDWDSGPSPLVSALLAASLRGVSVRVIVDAAPDGSGVASIGRLLEAASGAGATALRAAVAGGLEGASRVHAKGAIADGRRALLGSMNWVHASLARNREVDVAIDGAEVVSRLSRSFEADWCASVAAAPASPPVAMLGSLLDGWTPSEDPFPPAPDRAEAAAGIDWSPAIRVVIVVGGGLVVWEAEHRWAPLRRARARLSAAARALGDMLPRMRGFSIVKTERQGPLPNPHDPPPSPGPPVPGPPPPGPPPPGPPPPGPPAPGLPPWPEGEGW